MLRLNVLNSNLFPILDHNNKCGLSVLPFSDHGTVQLPTNKNKKKEYGSSYYDKWSLNDQN